MSKNVDLGLENVLFQLPVEDTSVEAYRLVLKHCPELLEDEDFDGHTLLQNACYDEAPELVKLLVEEFKADVNKNRPIFSCRFGVKCAEILMENGVDLKLTDDQGNNVLHVLAENTENSEATGIIELVAFCAEREPSLLKMKNGAGLVPLQVALNLSKNEVGKIFIDKMVA